MKRKIASIVAMSIIATNTMPAINVFADEVIKEKAIAIEKQVSKNMTVTDFNIRNNNNFNRYNELYRVGIKSIKNNGGNYPNSQIEKAIDGQLNTHWETMNKNTSDFKNEVIIELDEVSAINRLAYATRQDDKGKGYPIDAEIYVSESGNEHDFVLAGKVTGTKATGNMVEFRFDTVNAKKVKFVFEEVHREWASAAEFWFYKEDKTLDNMGRLFTNSNMNEVSEEFRSLDKLKALEDSAKEHPFYENFKEDINNARKILENNPVNFIETKVSKLLGYGTKYQEAYDSKFMLGKNHIINTEVNGGTYPTTKIEYMYDGDPNTHWETNRNNDSSFKNEVIYTFDEIETLDRIALLPRSGNQKGFPTKYEIYASETSKGDTFKLVSSGTAKVTKDFMQFKFNPTNFKRLKFVFKECHENRAFISEARFYKQDAVSEKMERLFTNSDMNQVSDEFKFSDKLKALEDSAKEHPFYENFKEDIENAKKILENNTVNFSETKVSKLLGYGTENSEAYDNKFMLNKKHIINTEVNGGSYPGTRIEDMYDNNPNTHWETKTSNSSSFTNEVIFTFDEIQNLDRIALLPRSGNQKGFPTKYEIYASETSKGNTFKLVSSGTAQVTKDFMQFKFNPTNFKRLKFVFKECHQNRAFISEARFYKQDAVSEKMSRLFTDSNMNKINSEFGTTEKLKDLEKECKEHPLYDDFKEDIDNAKIILESKEVEVSSAVTKKFNYINNKAYLDKFRMPYDNIKNISNNAGQYTSQYITLAVDGKLDTYWETNKGNTDDWKNEVTVEFKEPVTLDKVAYGARQSDKKGFIEGFEIYASETSRGETFQLVATGKASSTDGLVISKFKPTTFKRIRLKVITSNQNWASINELMFFKPDALYDKLNNIFVDQTQSELKPEYNSKEAIDDLEKETDTHPLKEELKEVIKRARKILDNTFEGNVLKLTLPQNGNIPAHCKNNLLMSSFGTNYISTGVMATPGEIIEVYVDAEPGKPLPEIVFSQAQGRYNYWNRHYTLSPGYNRFEVPKIYDEKWTHKVNPGGAIYFVNPYTPDEQGQAPKVILEGGREFPVYHQGDNKEEFLKELADYNEYLKANPDTAVDIFEYESPRLLFTGRASDAHQVYNVEKVDVAKSTLVWSDTIDDLLKFAGLEDNAEDIHHDSTGIKTAIRIMQPFAGAYAWSDHIGLQYNVADDFLRIDQNSMNGIRWGVSHEVGHQTDIRPRTWGEITNNMGANEQYRKNGQPDRVNYNVVYDKVSSDFDTNYAFGDLDQAARLGMFWQLRIFKDDYWKQIERMYRDRRPNYANEQEKIDIFVEYSSEVIGYNMIEHFERYGMKVSEECKSRLSKYPKLDKKTWYGNNSVIDYKGEGFNENVKIDVTPKLNKTEKTVTLNFNIDKGNKDDLLGYEVRKDSKVIGFTASDSFVVKNVDVNENTKYEVIPYSKTFGTSEPISVQTQQPRIESEAGLTLMLGEEFNPLDHVKAFDYEGNEIRNIKVTNKVNNKQKGSYTVTYEVSANGILSKKVMDVNVVSEYDYLSDSEWKSVVTGHGNPSRNDSIKGRTLGEVKDYAKGIRVHANGEVVYDLGEHNYDNFEVKVGVDMNIAAQENSSITFKVVGDGKTLATTKVLKHADNMQYINVPIKGIKELKIEVNDGGNGKTSDHGIMVEPKLTTNNAKPKLTIPKSQTVKVGESLESIVGTYKATDAEEGNLTEKVVVTGQDKVNFNRVGSYTLTYSVTDKDGNTTEKSRVINVVNTEDFKYLSDFDWKSATKGWGTIGKDISVSGGKLRLTGEDKSEVVYEKGIGTHAKSEIVYDLTDKDATLFSAFVGVDRAMYNGPSSIEFKVYVDGELAYESGIMRARDTQKFVEVDIAGAKELKLVATDGGDSNGSDHSNWADAKLYFVNTDRIDTTDLDKAIEDAKKVNKDDYTEESVKTLEDKLAKAEVVAKEENPSQEAIDTATSELQESIKGLVRINLDEVVNIPDEYLAKSLSKALGKNDNFTIGDMRKLTNFNVGYGVVSLEGLQYAKNLEIINGENNEIRDLRPISKLENLKEVNFNNQFVQVGQLKSVDGVVKVNTEVYNRSGKNVATKVKLVDNKGNLVKEQIIDKNTKEVDLDVRGIQSGFYGVHVTFEDSELSGTLLYMASI